MNLGEAKDRVIKVIKEYSNKGTVISDGDNADYINVMNDYFDIAQKEIATTNKLIPKKYQYIHRDLTGVRVDEIEHTTAEIIYEMVGCQSYYMEVSGYATIYVEEEILGVWTVHDTINNTLNNVSYRGNITVDVNNNVRVRLTGSYLYTVTNLAMYPYLYPTDALVPNYGSYMVLEMPSDYYSLKKILVNGKISGDYMRDTVGKVKYILLPYSNYGSIEIQYNAFPTTITSVTADNTEFELEEDAIQAMIFYVGYMCKIDDDVYVANAMQEEYMKKLNILQDHTDEGVYSVIDVRGWS